MPATTQWPGPFIPTQGSDLKAEDLTSQINGSATQFTISEQFIATQVFVFLNGLFQGPPNGSEITINSSTQFTIATTPLTGDKLAVIYSPLIKQ
jgi:hypothetical protein